MGKRNKALKNKQRNQQPTQDIKQDIKYPNEFTVTDLINFCNNNSISLNTPIRIVANTPTLWLCNLEQVKLTDGYIALRDIE